VRRAPWLSVILPTFNGMPYLLDALRGIEIQGDPDIEVIAVDDGSVDGTIEALESHRARLPLRILRPEPLGNWVTKTNLGLAEAVGQYVGFLHQDDYWRPGRLARIKPVLEAHPETALLLHATWYVDADGRYLRKLHCPLPRSPLAVNPTSMMRRLLIKNFISIPAAVFRRDLLSPGEGMDPSLWYTADWDLWLRIAARGTTRYLPDLLTAYRLHAGSLSSARKRTSAEFREQLETVLERHLPAWRRTGVEPVARACLELDVALAALAQHEIPELPRVLGAILRLGTGRWVRYLRDSVVLERVWSRVGLWFRPLPHP
jgi:glycosyltransferase involved in cell wall biosynthesis